MRFHRLQNVQIALDFLKQRQVRRFHAFPILPGNAGVESPLRNVLSAPRGPSVITAPDWPGLSLTCW